MPIYQLKCANGHAFSEFIQRHTPREIPCPHCGKTDCEPDFSEMRIVTERRFAGQECESLMEGFSPDEVPEARQLFPESTIRDDGTVIFSKRSDVKYFARRREEIPREENQRKEKAVRGQIASLGRRRR